MARNILQSSLTNAGFSIIFQIFCRVVTFGINAFIVRSVEHEVLGIMNVRLLLLESTILFLSREAINRAALSATSQQNEKCSWAQLINQIWLTVPICLILCIPCTYIWLNMMSSVTPQYINQYRFACYAVSISCIIELCAEVPVFITQVFCFVKLKIFLNTMHILVRSAIFLWIVLGNGSAAINAFAIAQLASSVTIVLGHYGFFLFYIREFNTVRDTTNTSKTTKSLFKSTLFDDMVDFPFRALHEMLPGVLHNKSSIFNTELQILTLSFLKQGFVKQILTEGEKYVMSMSPVLNLKEQATYDVVNNLGSLAARFIFRPIEDSSYFYFTQTIARDVALIKQEQNKVMQAGYVLSNLIIGVTSIGLLAFTFGQSFSHTLLLLYGGADFVEGGLPAYLLQWHCLAICFLAVNGITEGYMFATNTSSDNDRYNYFLAIFSVSFLFLSYFLTSIFGPVGFIFANCINMFCRICYSLRFIKNQYQPVKFYPLIGLLPGKLFACSLVVVGLFLKYSLFYTESIYWHLLYGVVGGVVCIAAWSLENINLLKTGWSYFQKQKKQKTI